MFRRELEVATGGPGLVEVTAEVAAAVRESGLAEGMCQVFVRHTSASLCISENADPDVRRDLEEFMARLVPENQPWFRHTCEGPDDMPSHIRSILTAVSVEVPVVAGRLGLGTWQGIYLWEHRAAPHRRKLLVSVWG